MVVHWLSIMHSSQFLDVIQKFHNVNKLYDGCFSADSIPKTLKTGHFIICNTDIASGEGIHWYTVIRSSSKELECFDSLGIDEEKAKFLKEHFKFRNVKSLIYNTTRFNIHSILALYF